jgi:hypothetical protein
MATGLKPPAKLELAGNLQEQYAKWIDQYNIYAKATGVTGKDEAVQCSVFLHVAGPEAQEIAQTFVFPEEQKDKIDPLKAKMKEHCDGKRNITLIRYRFNTTNQNEGQSFDNYLIELRHKIEYCEYAGLKDSLLMDRIICGIRDYTVREKLLHTDELNLAKCIDICRISEINVVDLKAPAEQKEVSAINKRYNSKQPFNRKPWNRNPQKSSRCYNCGQSHEKYKCPAYHATCEKCKKRGHFTDVCLSGSQSQRHKHKSKKKHYKSRKVHEIEESEDSSSSESESEEFEVSRSNHLFLGSIVMECDVHEMSEAPWTETIGGIKYKLDTGSQVNTIPKKCVPPTSNISPTSVVLRV